MIPKIIHYGWFGPDMPLYVKKRVAFWKRKLPDWKFMFWNNDNYSFDRFEFTKHKLENQEWGYATDELRFDVLNRFGGFYLDTDMLIKKDLEELCYKDLVMGFMYDNSLLTSFIGSKPNNDILKQILNMYADSKYDELKNNLTNNPLITYFLKKHFPNIKLNGETQEFAHHSMIYSRDYFCYPSKNTEANFAEHLFDNAWDHGNAYSGLKGEVKRTLRKIMPITYGNISNKRGMEYTESLMLKIKNHENQ